MNGKDIEFLLKSVDMWMKVLSTRMMLIMTLLLTFGLYAWAMWANDILHLAIASAFAVIVFLPVRALDSPKEKQHAGDNQA